jgi:hypothetical protein
MIGYEMVSKIFRTDGVKIITFNTRFIGRHHPRSSSLPHVDTGPTVSSIFERFVEALFCQSVKHSLNSAWISSVVSNRRPFCFSFIFGNKKKSQGNKSPAMTLGKRFNCRRRAEEVQCRRLLVAASPQMTYTTQINACENCLHSPSYVQLGTLTH